MNRKVMIGILLGIAIRVYAVEEPPNPVPVPPRPLDLQTCYELAVLNSQTLGMSEEDIRIAQAKYWQAIGTALPKVHVIGTEVLQNTGSSSGSSSSSNSDFGTTDSSGDASGGRGDRFTSRLNIKQPIFSGFRDFYTAAAGRQNIEARKKSRERNLQLVYLDVSDIFYQILMYEGDLRIQTEIQEALKKRIEDLEERVRLGKSRKGELLMASADLAQSLATLEQIKGLLGASREVLAFLIHVPASSIKLQDASPFPAVEILETYLSKIGERPDLLAATHEKEAASKLLSSSKGEHWPTISAEGNYYIKQIPSNNQEWNLFLTMDIPIFEGGMIEARVNQKKAELRSSELNLENLRRTATKDVRTAYNNFIAALAQVTRLGEATRISEQNYDVQSKDYQRGITSNLDVLDALRQMYDARRHRLDAEMDARINLIRLHVAAGDLQ